KGWPAPPSARSTRSRARRTWSTDDDGFRRGNANHDLRAKADRVGARERERGAARLERLDVQCVNSPASRRGRGSVSKHAGARDAILIPQDLSEAGLRAVTPKKLAFLDVNELEAVTVIAKLDRHATQWGRSVHVERHREHFPHSRGLRSVPRQGCADHI